MCVCVCLLAKHEQKPPSAEQPFPECRGGEEQGNDTHGDFIYLLLLLLLSQPNSRLI